MSVKSIMSLDLLKVTTENLINVSASDFTRFYLKN